MVATLPQSSMFAKGTSDRSPIEADEPLLDIVADFEG